MDIMTGLNKEALLPCPFCGGEAIGPTKMRVVSNLWVVSCKNCDARRSGRFTEAAAIAAWNTRAALPMGEPDSWRGSSSRYPHAIDHASRKRSIADGYDILARNYDVPLFLADAFPPRPQEDALREALKPFAEGCRKQAENLAEKLGCSAEEFSSPDDLEIEVLDETGDYVVMASLGDFRRASALLSEQEVE
jgi:Lar family restriction alleviation protein